MGETKVMKYKAIITIVDEHCNIVAKSEYTDIDLTQILQSVVRDTPVDINQSVVYMPNRTVCMPKVEVAEDTGL
jgi:K+ transporter